MLCARLKTREVGFAPLGQLLSTAITRVTVLQPHIGKRRMGLSSRIISSDGDSIARMLRRPFSGFYTTVAPMVRFKVYFKPLLKPFVALLNLVF